MAAVLAQLEQYRGRSRTAAQLLAGLTEPRCGLAPGRSAVQDVAHRLSTVTTPWWCADPRTAWPGHRWWAQQGPA